LEIRDHSFSKKEEKRKGDFQMIQNREKKSVDIANGE